VRRIAAFVLLGLGVFAVALGLLLRLYAYPKLAKAPLEQDTTSVAKGTDITALVIDRVDGVPTPEVREGLSLTSTTHVTGDLTQPEVVKDGDTAVYVEAIRTTDDDSGLVVNASVRALCVDRHTAEAIAPCEGQYVEKEQGERQAGKRGVVQQPGLSFKFPFAAEKRDYRYYDLSVGKAVTARFDGSATVQGLDVYRYVMTVPPTKIDTREVPGSLVGEDDTPSVKADLYYEVVRTVWVEPETGIIVVGEQQGKQELVVKGQEPGEGTLVFDGTLRFTGKTIDANVAKAGESKDKLALLTSWPLAMWIGGGVLIVAGVVLLLGGSRRSGAHAAGSVVPRRSKVSATE
jgi:DUF3068 family protein